MSLSPTGSAAALWIVSAAALSAQSVDPEFVIRRSTDTTGSSWSMLPFVYADGTDPISILSPGGTFGGSSDGTSFSSGLPGFSMLESEVTGTPWTLTVDPDVTARVFEFDMAFDNLSAGDFGEVLLIQPADLNAAPASPQFAWSGPSGMDSLDFILQREDYSVVIYESLDAAATSHDVGTPLDPGNYRLTIRYTRPLDGDAVAVGEPYEQGGGDSLFDAAGYAWGPSLSLWAEGSYQFTVVPEPSIGLLAIVGLAGLVRRRR